MENPKSRLAIVYDRSAVSGPELEAAMSGIRRFSRFGVECEGIEVSDRKALATVKRGERIRDMIGREKTVLNPMDLHSLLIREAFTKPREVMGIGIMGGELASSSGGEGERQVASTGVSLIGVGGVVTLRKIRATLDWRTAESTIEAAVAHEAGHILGIRGHCADAACLMRENEHLEDFVEITVRQARDLCARCNSLIRSFISVGMERGQH